MEMTRKEFLRRIAAGCAAAVLPPREGFAGDSVLPASVSLSIPYPAKPWSQVKQIVGDRPQLALDGLKGKAPSFDRTPLYNDFCLMQSGEPAIELRFCFRDSLPLRNLPEKTVSFSLECFQFERHARFTPRHDRTNAGRCFTAARG